jgi:hypothetical protein
MTDPKKMSDPDVRPPFWRHRYYYLVLKLAVLAVALYVAARFIGYLWASP